MEIISLSGKRYDLAIELFCEGKDCLKYENVYFFNKQNALEVVTNSEWELERTTEKMARDKIENSKLVMKELSSKSQEFNFIEAKCKKEFVFCFDYHTGAVMVANEINGIFKWHL